MAAGEMRKVRREDGGWAARDSELTCRPCYRARCTQSPCPSISDVFLSFVARILGGEMGAHFNGASLAFCHDGMRVPWASNDGNRVQVMGLVNYGAGVDRCNAWVDGV